MSAALFAVAQAMGFLLLAPLLRGLIKKMKAAFQLRQGPRLRQPYCGPGQAPAQGAGALHDGVLGVRGRAACLLRERGRGNHSPPDRLRRRPARGRGRHPPAGGPPRPGPLRPGDGRPRHREPVRGHGREPRDDRRGPGRARAHAGALHGRALGRVAQPGGARAAHGGARHFDPPGRNPGRGGALHRAPRRGGPRPHRQPRHPPRADHDPRGHGARVQRHRPRPRRVGLRRQGAPLHDPARGPLLPDRRRDEPRSAGAWRSRRLRSWQRSSLSRSWSSSSSRRTPSCASSASPS